MGQDHVRLRVRHVRRGAANVIDVAAAPSYVELHVATNRPAELLESLPKPRYPRLSLQVVVDAQQNADAPHSFALLRTHAKRPRDCSAAQKRDELAPLHVPP